jgi:hypothetical protein
MKVIIYAEDEKQYISCAQALAAAFKKNQQEKTVGYSMNGSPDTVWVDKTKTGWKATYQKA